MKRILILSIQLFTYFLLSAQGKAYEENQQTHNLFIYAFLLVFIICIVLLLVVFFLYKKGRSNRRRLHDLRLDMKEMKEELDNVKIVIERLQLHPKDTNTPKVVQQPIVPEAINQAINPIHQRVKVEYPQIYDANIKYASSVNIIDNTFFSITDTPTDTTIFVMNIDRVNSQKATFRIYEGAIEKIKKVEHFLDHGCNVTRLNEYENTPWKKIVIKTEGVCSHVDSKWVVVEKINMELQ